MIIAQRIVRHKGSTVATRKGKLFVFASVEHIIASAKKRKQVFAYLTEDGAEGTVRSGRRMRKVDSHVRNVTQSGLRFL